MGRLRKPFEGVGNILRFNWHFYALAVIGTVFGLFLAHQLGGVWWKVGLLVAGLVLLTTLTSLLVSWYVYDRSSLYGFTWLNASKAPRSIVNIHAGFDETSRLLANRFPAAHLRVLDFYDPELHTEVSIKRARLAYPPYPGTETISTNALFLENGSTDLILTILAAHEIRDDEERIAFFAQLKMGLTASGTIVVVEHIRDAANFLAYTLGCFHFLPRNTWLDTFAGAGLAIVAERKVTPFVTVFTLQPHGDPP